MKKKKFPQNFSFSRNFREKLSIIMYDRGNSLMTTCHER